MKRELAGAVLLLAVVPFAAGEEPIRLTLRPAAAPVPALKYRLLPEVRELMPGNAAQLYYRAFSPEWWGYYRRELYKQVATWSENPRQAPPQNLRMVQGFKPLQEVDLAARRAYCDWEFLERVRKEGYSLLLPDIQGFREFGNLLALRARFETADGHFDRAVHTLQTGFAFSRHVADAPILINALVGMAVSSQIMLEQVEELIQTPGSPNLYWALTDLPRPFIDMRKSLQGERVWMDHQLPGFREMLATPRITPLSVPQLREYLDRLVPLLRSEARAGSELEVRMAFTLLAAKAYPEAKRLLIAQGRSAEQVEALPMLQVAFLHEVYQYDRLYDEMLKWSGLPYPEARRGVEQAERLLKEHVVQTGGPGMSLAGLLLPAVSRVVFASFRTDRRIAALRCIEAIRLYAAAHGGKLPATLDDIADVPIPLDPVTGKGFEYRVSGDKATLYGPPPAGEMPRSNNTVNYELTLKR